MAAYLSAPLFWLSLYFLLYLTDFTYCRVLLHQASQVRGFFRAIPVFFILAAGSILLARSWDFQPSSWGRLEAGLKVWTVLLCLFSVVLLLRQAGWYLFIRKPVRFRLVRREKVPAPFPPPGAFLSRIGLKNQLYDLRYAEYDLEPPGWPAAWSGLTILHLSDVHHSRFIHDGYLCHVRRRMEAWKSDLVVFTGDFIAGGKDLPDAFRWLRGLRAPLGVWAVLGNHEGWTDPVGVARSLERAGVRVFFNRARLFRRKGSTLALLGAEDYWTGGKDLSYLEKAALGSQARILLAHQPDQFFMARKLGAHLQLSGHCHGGQICLPGGIPLIAPSRFGIRYTGGFYREGESILFVSRGVGADPPLRLFCPPEIVKIRIVSPGKS